MLIDGFILFYLFIFGLILFLLYIDDKDYECNFIQTRQPSLSYCSFMIDQIPNDDDSREIRRQKRDKLLDKLSHIVYWRRALLIAIFSTFLVGIYLNNGCLLDPLRFVISTILIFVIAHFSFMWLSFHYIYPVTTILKSN
jgi:hypothetical protein